MLNRLRIMSNSVPCKKFFLALVSKNSSGIYFKELLSIDLTFKKISAILITDERAYCLVTPFAVFPCVTTSSFLFSFKIFCLGLLFCSDYDTLLLGITTEPVLAVALGLLHQ